LVGRQASIVLLPPDPFEAGGDLDPQTHRKHAEHITPKLHVRKLGDEHADPQDPLFQTQFKEDFPQQRNNLPRDRLQVINPT
jgi:hypothetical protein